MTSSSRLSSCLTSSRARSSAMPSRSRSSSMSSLAPVEGDCTYQKPLCSLSWTGATCLGACCHAQIIEEIPFELWYLLHFHYYDAAMSRADYGNMLNNLLGMQYRKNRDDMYDLLRSRQVDAMRNAKRLLEQYNPSNPALDNPSTTVHLLVEELN